MDLLIALVTAVALGALVGLERERAKVRHGGIRTYPMATLLGVLMMTIGAWAVAAGVLALTALLVMSNLASMKSDEDAGGQTSEIALLVMFGVGALLGMGQTMAAVVTGGIVMVLLYNKPVLHGAVQRMEDAEVRAIARLALIALVILPLLPNEPMGPYGVLNPFALWLMVVLITGLSLAAYLISKFAGPGKGTLVSGVLGGMISSTATTTSQARRSVKAPDASAAPAIIILVASAVVFVRVMFETAVAAPNAQHAILPPLGAMLGCFALLTAAAWWWLRKRIDKAPPDEVPADMKGALGFAVLFGIVLVATAFAKQQLGAGGLYVVAAVSGLTDMDAIALSTSRLVQAGELDASTGWRVILTGGMANILFKGGVVAILGAPSLRLPVLTVFGLSLVCGGLLIAFWPSF